MSRSARRRDGPLSKREPESRRSRNGQSSEPLPCSAVCRRSTRSSRPATPRGERGRSVEPSSREASPRRRPRRRPPRRDQVEAEQLERHRAAARGGRPRGDSARRGRPAWIRRSPAKPGVEGFEIGVGQRRIDRAVRSPRSGLRARSGRGRGPLERQPRRARAGCGAPPSAPWVSSSFRSRSVSAARRRRWLRTIRSCAPSIVRAGSAATSARRAGSAGRAVASPGPASRPRRRVRPAARAGRRRPGPVGSQRRTPAVRAPRCVAPAARRAARCAARASPRRDPRDLGAVGRRAGCGRRRSRSRCPRRRRGERRRRSTGPSVVDEAALDLGAHALGPEAAVRTAMPPRRVAPSTSSAAGGGPEAGAPATARPAARSEGASLPSRDPS